MKEKEIKEKKKKPDFNISGLPLCKKCNEYSCQCLNPMPKKQIKEKIKKIEKQKHWIGGSDFELDEDEVVDKINEIIDYLNKCQTKSKRK